MPLPSHNYHYSFPVSVQDERFPELRSFQVGGASTCRSRIDKTENIELLLYELLQGSNPMCSMQHN